MNPYPVVNAIPNVAYLPQPWVDSLNAAVAAGKIPNIPSTNVVNSYPVYPNNLNAGDPSICSSYVECRIENDVWDAPPGIIGIGFDDGPLPVCFIFGYDYSPINFIIGFG